MKYEWYDKYEMNEWYDKYEINVHRARKHSVLDLLFHESKNTSVSSFLNGRVYVYVYCIIASYPSIKLFNDINHTNF